MERGYRLKGVSSLRMLCRSGSMVDNLFDCERWNCLCGGLKHRIVSLPNKECISKSRHIRHTLKRVSPLSPGSKEIRTPTWQKSHIKGFTGGVPHEDGFEGLFFLIPPCVTSKSTRSRSTPVRMKTDVRWPVCVSALELLGVPYEPSSHRYKGLSSPKFPFNKSDIVYVE